MWVSLFLKHGMNPTVKPGVLLIVLCVCPQSKVTWSMWYAHYRIHYYALELRATRFISKICSSCSCRKHSAKSASWKVTSSRIHGSIPWCTKMSSFKGVDISHLMRPRKCFTRDCCWDVAQGPWYLWLCPLQWGFMLVFSAQVVDGCCWHFWWYCVIKSVVPLCHAGFLKIRHPKYGWWFIT